MTTNAAVTADLPERKLIAPVWHTALLVGLFLLLTVSGSLFQRGAQANPGALQQHPRMWPVYLSLIAMEWALVWYVWRGVRRTGTRLRDLIGGRWASAKDVLVDAILACGLWALWVGVTTAWEKWLGASHAASIRTFLPERMPEILLWIAVSISAGICEEIVFRGYLQQQCRALTHSGFVAVFLQAVLFGISHGYQGVEATIKIAIYGALFGLLALWRKSLRPGMVAHAWSDIFSGIIAR